MDKLIYSIVYVKNNSSKLDALLSTMEGFSGAKLSAVTVNDLSAIISDINKDELIANQPNAVLFAGIIEKLEQQFTLLPMRFGSTMESIGQINTLLEKNYPEFLNNLLKVENKFEFGLKIFCDTEKLKEELRAKSEGEKEISQNADTEIINSVFKEYVNKKLKEHRLEEMLVSYIDSIISEFSEFLNQLNALSKINKRTNASNIIDAVFLLEKDKKDELVRIVEKLQSQHQQLNFILTGPWAPYNFVDINIK
ncbi:MAG: GvpL/GvpF family gas vesicle protein [Bacteroidetes bacterium]|nr:GvpL/GvpF family gas vesicle protein [Bacteroidota bacterium]